MKNKKIIRTIKDFYKTRFYNPRLVKNKQKIFCIGQNKTGTTSLKKAFEDLNFVVGKQSVAEQLFKYYKVNDFSPIIRYSKTAQVFQDVPFSLPNTFRHLDKAYPNSKFILSIRDSPEQWYASLTKFHSKIFGKGNIPTRENLMNTNYVWKGWAWEINQMLYKTPPNNPYKKEILIKCYKDYNLSVLEYFKNRPDDLIVINIAEKNSYNKLMNFLNIDSPYTDFPWENKTEKIGMK